MLYRTNIVALAAILAASLALSTTCDNNPVRSQKPDFEVHEWGVMVGCVQDTSYFVTSRPEISHQVDIPVIYIHTTTDITTFDAQVAFAVGTPTATFPQAVIDSNTVTWDSVQVIEDPRLPLTESAGDHVPLEHIIPVLNDVDADLLRYDTTVSRFLFYEGQMRFTNVVEVSYDFEMRQAEFTNTAGYPVFDVIVTAVAVPDTFWFPATYVATVPKLPPGGHVTTEFSMTVAVDLMEMLTSQGFSLSEAEAFAQLWTMTFLSPVFDGVAANLIYRLPQGEYDRLISLDIDPQPDRLIRALYTLVHLQR